MTTEERIWSYGKRNISHTKVQEIHLSNKLEKSGQIQLDSSFSLNVSFSSGGSRCVGKLQQTLRDKEFVGGKFTMTVELVGIFNCSNATTDEVKRQVHGGGL